jgi:tetratricopeptide (TPR) repeat protein
VRPSVPAVFVLFLSICCTIGQSAQGESQTWIKLTTPKFELYTDTSSLKAKNLLSLFESADAAALRPTDKQPETNRRLRIIAFANSSEYAPFRLKTAALGHYLHARDRDYVVLSDAEPEHFEAAVHEYTHYAVNRAGLHLPLWLNEGIADLYSTTAVSAGTPLLGAPLAGRVGTLMKNQVLPLRAIFAAGRASSLYNRPEITPLFYAESWLFTRLLAVDDRYSARFPEFVTALSEGRSSAQALSDIYGITPEQFDAQLPAYLTQVEGGRTVTLAHSREQAKPEETALSEFERRMIWADLLAAHPATAGRAKEQLMQLDREFPGHPETQEVLGHIAWESKHPDEARALWLQAVEEGSRDYTTLYRLALLVHENGGPSSQVITLLEKALELKPDCDEAVYNLGLLKYGDGEFARAWELLSRLRTVAPEHAYTYYSVVGYCQMKLKTFDRARLSLERASQSARTPEEQAENLRMLQFARGVETERMSGKREAS